MGAMNELVILTERVEELTEGFFSCEKAEQEARAGEYREILQPALLAAYGQDADAYLVDPWTAETYSDLYKDRYNVRPRGHSYRSMMAFMNNVPPLEDFEDEEELLSVIEAREAAEAAATDGDRFDPDISKWEDETQPGADFNARLKDYEDVYGVPAFGQAMRFAAAEMENY